jgi:ectoine hydroxylase-related dioxygenase (phytanoyl-CoA dioxygenase family)
MTHLSLSEEEIISNYQNYGVVLLRSFFTDLELEPYFEKHNSKIHNSTDWTESYLDSRESWHNDETIKNLLCGKKINEIFSILNLKMRMTISEARLSSSNIQWHRDVVYKAPEYKHHSVVSIAMSDASADAGWISYVPGSHLWDVDYDIVGLENLLKDPLMCYKYYEDLIHSKNAEVKRFDAKKGDILIWDGHTIHCGESNPKEKSLRHSLTGHFINMV